MLRSPSSPISDDGVDFDFFESGARLTDTGVHSAEVVPPLPVGSAADEVGTEASTYVVALGTRRLRLARDPMAGTGGLLWPAGKVLAEYLSRLSRAEPDVFRDRRLLELGSGTGVVGLSVALSVELGAGKVYLTDLERVLPVLERNVALNGHPGGVEVRELAWGVCPSAPELCACDVILLADCIYLEVLFEPLMQTLREVMIKDDVVAYLCYKKRRRADAKFFKMLRKDFRVEELEQEAMRAKKESMHLFKIVRK